MVLSEHILGNRAFSRMAHQPFAAFLDMGPIHSVTGHRKTNGYSSIRHKAKLTETVVLNT